jgi:L-fucose mutarotase
LLRFPLIHPPLLGVLARAGHGSKILLADANYAHDVNVRQGAPVIHLNLRPGLVAVDDVLETLIEAVPIETAHVMRPDEGETPEVFGRFRSLLGPELPLRPLGRREFYQACQQDDVAACVASGDDRLYANVLLTIGVVPPRG